VANNVIELRYGLDSFRSDWRHCSLGSDFLAETAFRTPRVKQIASAAINEVLELAFRLGAKGSKSWVQTTVIRGESMALALDVKIKAERIDEVRAAQIEFQVNPAAYFATRLGQADPGIFFGMGYLANDLHAQVSLGSEQDLLLVRVNVSLRASANED
jgi:hypothetical protein